jgi:hypothetical protein
MPQAGFESTTPVTKHKTYVLDRAATDTKYICVRINEEMNEWMERRGSSVRASDAIYKRKAYNWQYIYTKNHNINI